MKFEINFMMNGQKRIVRVDFEFGGGMSMQEILKSEKLVRLCGLAENLQLMS
jgi:hypothetical protein